MLVTSTKPSVNFFIIIVNIHHNRHALQHNQLLINQVFDNLTTQDLYTGPPIQRRSRGTDRHIDMLDQLELLS